MIASPPVAIGQEPRAVDAVRAGWDADWLARYPDVDPGDPMADPDGDGVPNLFEMISNQDPFVAAPKVRAPARTHLQEQLRQRKIAEMQQRRAAALAPYYRELRTDAEGRSLTRARRLEIAAERTAALIPKFQQQEKEAQTRVAEFLKSAAGKKLSAAARASLRDVRDGRPVATGGFSHRQATLMNVINVWPGSPVFPAPPIVPAPPRSLDGAGTAVAMWDLGAVDSGHEQFTTGQSLVVAPDAVPAHTARVYNADSNPIINEHATAVATVIIGAGDGTPIPPQYTPTSDADEARGMAFAGGLRAYNAFQYISEMTSLASMSAAGQLDIVFSNHAHGTICGWNLPYLANPGTLWDWWGDPFLGETFPGAMDGKEDWKFGFYTDDSSNIDQVTASALTHLPVWAAGNDGRNIELGEAPEPMASQPVPGSGSLISPHFVFTTGQTFTASSPQIPGRYPDEGLGSLIPEACAKNVLTVTDSLVFGNGSHGPTDDWRMKPELQAPGGLGNIPDFCAQDATSGDYRFFRGTSFSSAAVTGCLALMRQRWVELYGTAPVLASTWKALAVAGAARGNFLKISGSDGYFGQFDLLNSIELVEGNAANIDAGSYCVVKEIELVEDGTSSFEIRLSGVGVNGFGSLFSVTACWTDPAAIPSAEQVNPDPVLHRKLINDIDLRVTSNTTGRVYWPHRVVNANGNVGTDAENDADNIEYVAVEPLSDEPLDGTFTVTIDHDGVLIGGSQLVSIVLSGAVAGAPHFRILDVYPLGGSYRVAWASEVGATYQIERSVDLKTWVVEPGVVIAYNLITDVDVQSTTAAPAEFYRVRKL